MKRIPGYFFAVRLREKAKIYSDFLYWVDEIIDFQVIIHDS
jgi:hypothetical protein